MDDNNIFNNFNNSNKFKFIAFLIICVLVAFILYSWISRFLYGNLAPTEDVYADEYYSNEINDNLKSSKVYYKDVSINFVAIGDVMCHSTNIKDAYNEETNSYDFSHVFKNVSKYIADADIAIR